MQVPDHVPSSPLPLPQIKGLGFLSHMLGFIATPKYIKALLLHIKNHFNDPKVTSYFESTGYDSLEKALGRLKRCNICPELIGFLFDRPQELQKVVKDAVQQSIKTSQVKDPAAYLSAYVANPSMLAAEWGCPDLSSLSPEDKETLLTSAVQLESTIPNNATLNQMQDLAVTAYGSIALLNVVLAAPKPTSFVPSKRGDWKAPLLTSCCRVLLHEPVLTEFLNQGSVSPSSILRVARVLLSEHGDCVKEEHISLIMPHIDKGVHSNSFVRLVLDHFKSPSIGLQFTLAKGWSLTTARVPESLAARAPVLASSVRYSSGIATLGDIQVLGERIPSETMEPETARLAFVKEFLGDAVVSLGEGEAEIPLFHPDTPWSIVQQEVDEALHGCVVLNNVESCQFLRMAPFTRDLVAQARPSVPHDTSFFKGVERVLRASSRYLDHIPAYVSDVSQEDIGLLRGLGDQECERLAGFLESAIDILPHRSMLGHIRNILIRLRLKNPFPVKDWPSIHRRDLEYLGTFCPIQGSTTPSLNGGVVQHVDEVSLVLYTCISYLKDHPEEPMKLLQDAKSLSNYFLTCETRGAGRDFDVLRKNVQWLLGPTDDLVLLAVNPSEKVLTAYLAKLDPAGIPVSIPALRMQSVLSRFSQVVLGEDSTKLSLKLNDSATDVVTAALVVIEVGVNNRGYEIRYGLRVPRSTNCENMYVAGTKQREDTSSGTLESRTAVIRSHNIEPLVMYLARECEQDLFKRLELVSDYIQTLRDIAVIDIGKIPKCLVQADPVDGEYKCQATKSILGLPKTYTTIWTVDDIRFSEVDSNHDLARYVRRATGVYGKLHPRDVESEKDLNPQASFLDTGFWGPGREVRPTPSGLSLVPLPDSGAQAGFRIIAPQTLKAGFNTLANTLGDLSPSESFEPLSFIALHDNLVRDSRLAGVMWRIKNRYVRPLMVVSGLDALPLDSCMALIKRMRACAGVQWIILLVPGSALSGLFPSGSTVTATDRVPPKLRTVSNRKVYVHKCEGDYCWPEQDKSFRVYNCDESSRLPDVFLSSVLPCEMARPKESTWVTDTFFTGTDPIASAVRQSSLFVELLSAALTGVCGLVMESMHTLLTPTLDIVVPNFDESPWSVAECLAPPDRCITFNGGLWATPKPTDGEDDPPASPCDTDALWNKRLCEDHNVDLTPVETRGTEGFVYTEQCQETLEYVHQNMTAWLEGDATALTSSCKRASPPPLILCGATGSSKTYLLRHYFKMIRHLDVTFNVTILTAGFVTKQLWKNSVCEYVREAKSTTNRGKNYVVMLDELNASDIGDSLKALFVDGMYKDEVLGRWTPLPPNLRFIGTCNPGSPSSSDSDSHRYHVYRIHPAVARCAFNVRPPTDVQRHDFIRRATSTWSSSETDSVVTFCTAVMRTIKDERLAEPSLRDLRSLAELLEHREFVKLLKYIRQGTVDNKLVVLIATFAVFGAQLTLEGFLSLAESHLDAEGDSDTCREAFESLLDDVKTRFVKEDKMVATPYVKQNFLLLAISVACNRSLLLVGGAGVSKTMCISSFVHMLPFRDTEQSKDEKRRGRNQTEHFAVPKQLLLYPDVRTLQFTQGDSVTVIDRLAHMVEDDTTPGTGSTIIVIEEMSLMTQNARKALHHLLDKQEDPKTSTGRRNFTVICSTNRLLDGSLPYDHALGGRFMKAIYEPLSGPALEAIGRMHLGDVPAATEEVFKSVLDRYKDVASSLRLSPRHIVAVARFLKAHPSNDTDNLYRRVVYTCLGSRDAKTPDRFLQVVNKEDTMPLRKYMTLSSPEPLRHCLFVVDSEEAVAVAHKNIVAAFMAIGEKKYRCKDHTWQCSRTSAFASLHRVRNTALSANSLILHNPGDLLIALQQVLNMSYQTSGSGSALLAHGSYQETISVNSQMRLLFIVHRSALTHIPDSTLSRMSVYHINRDLDPLPTFVNTKGETDTAAWQRLGAAWDVSCDDWVAKERSLREDARTKKCHYINACFTRDPFLPHVSSDAGIETVYTMADVSKLKQRMDREPTDSELRRSLKRTLKGVHRISLHGNTSEDLRSRLGFIEVFPSLGPKYKCLSVFAPLSLRRDLVKCLTPAQRRRYLPYHRTVHAECVARDARGGSKNSGTETSKYWSVEETILSDPTWSLPSLDPSDTTSRSISFRDLFSCTQQSIDTLKSHMMYTLKTEVRRNLAVRWSVENVSGTATQAAVDAVASAVFKRLMMLPVVHRSLSNPQALPELFRVLFRSGSPRDGWMWFFGRILPLLAGQLCARVPHLPAESDIILFFAHLIPKCGLREWTTYLNGVTELVDLDARLDTSCAASVTVANVPFAKHLTPELLRDLPDGLQDSHVVLRAILRETVEHSGKYKLRGNPDAPLVTASSVDTLVPRLEAVLRCDSPIRPADGANSLMVGFAHYLETRCLYLAISMAKYTGTDIDLAALSGDTFADRAASFAKAVGIERLLDLDADFVSELVCALPSRCPVRHAYRVYQAVSHASEHVADGSVCGPAIRAARAVMSHNMFDVVNALPGPLCVLLADMVQGMGLETMWAALHELLKHMVSTGRARDWCELFALTVNHVDVPWDAVKERLALSEGLLLDSPFVICSLVNVLAGCRYGLASEELVAAFRWFSKNQCQFCALAVGEMQLRRVVRQDIMTGQVPSPEALSIVKINDHHVLPLRNYLMRQVANSSFGNDREYCAAMKHACGDWFDLSPVDEDFLTHPVRFGASDLLPSSLGPLTVEGMTDSLGIDTALFEGPTHGAVLDALLRQVGLQCVLTPNQYVMGMRDDLMDTLRKLGTSTNSCVCGEIYVLTNCGRPMEISKCPSCGRPIGGTHHNYVAGNRAVNTGADLRGWQTQKDYMELRSLSRLSTGVARIAATHASLVQAQTQDAEIRRLWATRLEEELALFAKALEVSRDAALITMVKVSKALASSSLTLSFPSQAQRAGPEAAFHARVMAVMQQDIGVASPRLAHMQHFANHVLEAFTAHISNQVGGCHTGRSYSQTEVEAAAEASPDQYRLALLPLSQPEMPRMPQRQDSDPVSSIELLEGTTRFCKLMEATQVITAFLKDFYAVAIDCDPAANLSDTCKDIGLGSQYTGFTEAWNSVPDLAGDLSFQCEAFVWKTMDSDDCLCAMVLPRDAGASDPSLVEQYVEALVVALNTFSALLDPNAGNVSAWHTPVHVTDTSMSLGLVAALQSRLGNDYPTAEEADAAYTQRMYSLHSLLLPRGVPLLVLAHGDIPTRPLPVDSGVSGVSMRCLHNPQTPLMPTQIYQLQDAVAELRGVRLDHLRNPLLRVCFTLNQRPAVNVEADTVAEHLPSDPLFDCLRDLLAKVECAPVCLCHMDALLQLLVPPPIPAFLMKPLPEGLLDHLFEHLDTLSLTDLSNAISIAIPGFSVNESFAHYPIDEYIELANEDHLDMLEGMCICHSGTMIEALACVSGATEAETESDQEPLEVEEEEIGAEE
ncbi:hypothetical protein KIPB_004190 [Kipferlia bialata]|uniref:RZ-type domain-containing protein n=1 Tax=Kipferlia bialata TaxID=797122 RepID=A0A9K3CUN3_9EUKA|nr:hypothetical protein KIPB_004190 [Kipferlia bialata]|eukprot:g4190.t1